MCPHCNHSADYRSYVRRGLSRGKWDRTYERVAGKTAAALGICSFRTRRPFVCSGDRLFPGLCKKPLTHAGSNLCACTFTQPMQSEKSAVKCVRRNAAGAAGPVTTLSSGVTITCGSKTVPLAPGRVHAGPTPTQTLPLFFQRYLPLCNRRCPGALEACCGQEAENRWCKVR